MGKALEKKLTRQIFIDVKLCSFTETRFLVFCSAHYEEGREYRRLAPKIGERRDTFVIRPFLKGIHALGVNVVNQGFDVWKIRQQKKCAFFALSPF